MAIRSLNHAVLFVSDIEQSVEFYCRILGFERIGADFPGGAFLRGSASANDHDLGLFQGSAPAGHRGAIGLYHLAWEVETLSDLRDALIRLRGADALVGASDHVATKAVYGRDPDGIEFEVTWLVPDSELHRVMVHGMVPTSPLDIDGDIERFGATTPGGPRNDRALMHRIMARVTGSDE